MNSLDQLPLDRNQDLAVSANYLRREVILVFFIYLALWTLGNGLIPLLPLRAISLGISRSGSGLFLGLLYLSLVLGSLAGAQIAARAGSTKRALLASAMAQTFAFPLMAVSNIWCLGVFGCVCWFLFGIELCVLAIHANIIAAPAHRGRTLAILLSTSPLGAIVGGAGMGLIVNSRGFETVVLAASSLPLASLIFALGITARRISPVRTVTAHGVKLPQALINLATLNFLVNLAALTVRAASPLLMNRHGLSYGAPAMASAIGGFCAFPAAIFIGFASDQIGRRLILAFGYAAVSVSILSLIFANSFWGFAISSIFVSLFIYAMAGVRSAIIGDISTVEQLPRAVGIYEASAWAGGLVGFTGAGFGLQIFGSFYLLSLAILSAIASVAIIILNKSVKYFKYE